MKTNRTLLRLLSLLLVTLTVMGMLVACKPETPNDPSTPGSSADGFTPVVRFAVASDLHLRDDSGGYDFETRDQLKALYNTAYGYSGKQAYNKLDGVFLVGDFTQNGHATNEMKDYFDAVKKYTKDGTVSKSILGNHEFYYTKTTDPDHYDPRYSPESIKNTYANFKKYSGNENVDEHLVINGFHFIFLAMDFYKKSEGVFYSDAQLNWLKGELEKAAADDPTGLKPIFVMQHIGPSGTASGSDKNLGAVLKKYPQVVDFCGHSHTPLTHPKSIWQGDYTVLNTGSLAYLGIPLCRLEGDTTVIATDKFGGWATGDIENSLRTGGMYYIIEVDANNVMRVVIYDVFEDQVYGEPFLIDSIGQPDKFTFTNDRKRTAEAPQFAAGTELTTLVEGDTFASIKIPQATEGGLVQSYRCEYYLGNSKKGTVYRLAGSYLGAGRPDFVTLPLSGLTPGKTYTVKVIPVNDWGKVGTPLEIKVNTQMPGADPIPDILSVKFGLGGIATNATTQQPLDAVGNGTPKTELDTSLQQYVGVFDGKNGFRFPLYNSYKTLQDGFTMEAYVYVPSKPGSTVDIVSNQHSAGFGFELKSDGKVYFYFHDGNGWKTPSKAMPTGEWVHLVGVYDGNGEGGYVKLYVNGTLAAKAACNNFKIPSAAAQYLVIGGDANQYDGQFFMTGKIAMANIYSEPLSDAEIITLYNNLKK